MGQHPHDTYAGTFSTRATLRCPGTPYGHWKTTTFIAALRCHAVTAPMVTDGPMDGALFPAYVRTFLCPSLRPGDIVIADNLSSHKVAGVREAIEAVGATIRYLPPYSPDFNPIENSSPSSNRFCERRRHGQSTRSGIRLAYCLTTSHFKSALTTLHPLDM